MEKKQLAQRHWLTQEHTRIEYENKESIFKKRIQQVTSNLFWKHVLFGWYIQGMFIWSKCYVNMSHVFVACILCFMLCSVCVVYV